VGAACAVRLQAVGQGSGIAGPFSADRLVELDVAVDGLILRDDLRVEIDEGVFIDVTRDGTDVFQGAVDIFSVLGDLWTAIDSGTPADASSTITDLDLALSQLSQERSQIGGAENKANTFESRLRLQEQDLSGQISFLEDADAFEVFSDLAAQEAALQASLQVTSRLLSPTLLDFI